MRTEVQPTDLAWSVFQSVNRFRRAIRDFDGRPIPEDSVRAVLQEALLAPSSGNLQPFLLHWVRDPDVKRRVAQACNAQKAACTASEIIVVTADVATAARTCVEQLRAVDESVSLDAKSKAYHRRQLTTFRRFLRFAPAAIWDPVRGLMSAVFPVLSLLPLGPAGARQWAARGALFAAQTLLLAAAAQRLDSCPMEGFRARAVARALRLPRGTVIPLVIALGHRDEGARL